MGIKTQQYFKVWRLSFLSLHHKDKRGHWHALFKCSCGNKKIARISHVKYGSVKSCGCMLKENGIKQGKALATHGMSNTSEYVAWESMITRCQKLPNYHGRGIKVAKELQTFDGFIKVIGIKPFLNATLDRINVNGDYEPNNIRWATRRMQQRNTQRQLSKTNGVRKRKDTGKFLAYISINGKTKNLGSFNNIEEAIVARKLGEEKYWGPCELW